MLERTNSGARDSLSKADAPVTSKKKSSENRDLNLWGKPHC